MVAATGEREQRKRKREKEREREGENGRREEVAASLPFVSDSLGAGIMCGGRRKGGGRRKEGRKEGKRERDVA